LNLASCACLLVTLDSCIATYVGSSGARARAEYNIAKEIGILWRVGDDASDLRGLRRHLRRINASRGAESRRARAQGGDATFADGSALDDELFAPLRWAAEVASEELRLPAHATWLIAIDEAELLPPLMQRVINTVLRSQSGPFFYKVTTLPYAHYTLETNADRQLEVGHDFEYVRIDRDPIHDKDRSLTAAFVNEVYKRRRRLAPSKYPAATLHELFGPSPILDRGKGAWTSAEELMLELERHLLPSVAARARSVLVRDRQAFDNQYARRLRGTIQLRNALKSRPGHQALDVYAGAPMFVRCADGNPRRIIRLFKAMLDHIPPDGAARLRRGEPIVPTTTQTEVMSRYAADVLLRARSEESVGFDVFRLVSAIGAYARLSTYADRISTDAVTTVRVDHEVSAETWTAVAKACDLGLLYANVSWNHPDQWPVRSGYFHLAYALAPYFRILPRRGRARRLALILQEGEHYESRQLPLFEADVNE
jgi:hypothetical protein